MKCNLLFTTLLILTMINNLNAQEKVFNFEIIDTEVIWQKVYDTKMDFEQLTDKINNSGLFLNFAVDENEITGNIKPIIADFKGAGFGEMVMPMYIARSFFDGFVLINFKEGKYRVTLKKIVLIQKYNDVLTEQGEKSNLESWSLKNDKNEFKDAFRKSPSKILDYTFSKKFDFNGKNENEDW